MGGPHGVVLWVHGQRLGRLRLHHQLDPAPRVRVDLYGEVFSEVVRELYDVVCAGDVGEHADSVCGILADQEQRSYECAG